MSDDHPAFALSEERQALREAVRAPADDKIAPRAADVDHTSEFPWDVYEALVKADFQAVHIPEAYGGAGADAIATAIVIEEVARACASSSLIPAVNKLGTMPLMIAASEDVKARVPGAGRARRGDVLLRTVRAGGRLGRGGHANQGGTHRLRLRAERGEALDHQRRGVEVLHGDGVTDPSAGANGISAFVLEDGDPGFTFGAPEYKLGIKGSPTRELYFGDCAIRPTGWSAPRARGSRSPSARWTTPASRSRRRPWASPRARSTTRSATSGSASSSAGRSPTSRACSS